MRPRRRKREHPYHQRPGITGSQPGVVKITAGLSCSKGPFSWPLGQPGTSQSPSSTMSTPVKHPQAFQRPRHPKPPRSAANHNSARPNLLDQAELGRLCKSARNPPLDLVKTTSPGLTSPSLAYSDLIETTSLGRPLGR